MERVIPGIEVRRPERSKADRITCHMWISISDLGLRYLKIPMSRSTPAKDTTLRAPHPLRYLPGHPPPGESSDVYLKSIGDSSVSCRKTSHSFYTSQVPVHAAISTCTLVLRHLSHSSTPPISQQCTHFRVLGESNFTQLV